MSTYKSFASLLENINNPKKEAEVTTIIESEEILENIEDNGQEYIITEGWNDDDISLLESHYGEEDALDLLSESIFGGTPNHIIKNIVHAEMAPGGESSKITTSQASNKGHIYNHLKGDNIDGNHTIVKHNGKVIASMHPASGKTNIKYNTSGAAEGSGDKHVSKGKAFQHLYDTIEKHGGYKGHNVSIHTFHADEKRDATAQDRRTARLSQDKPKSFSDIASRAAGKLADKHTKSPETIAKNHNRKISHRMKSLNANFAEAQKSGDYAAMVKHAGDLHDLVKNHPKHAEGDSGKSEAKTALQDGAKVIGRRKDAGEAPSKSIDSNHQNKKLAGLVKAVKEEQESYDLAMNEAYDLAMNEALKPTEGDQGDLFPKEKSDAIRNGGGGDEERAKKEATRKAIRGIFAKKNGGETDMFAKKKVAPTVATKPAWKSKSANDVVGNTPRKDRNFTKD